LRQGPSHEKRPPLRGGLQWLAERRRLKSPDPGDAFIEMVRLLDEDYAFGEQSHDLRPAPAAMPGTVHDRNVGATSRR